MFAAAGDLPLPNVEAILQNGLASLAPDGLRA